MNSYLVIFLFFWLHSSCCVAENEQSLLHQLYRLFTGNQTLTNIIPPNWLDYLVTLPGSGYLVAFIYWLRHPLLLCLLLPFSLIVFIYFTVILLHLYHLRYWLRRHLNRLLSKLNQSSEGPSSASHVCLDSLAELLRRIVAAVWDAHGRIFHGYEVIGMEKLPTNGPAYLVYYHGTCPFDAYYFTSRYCIERDRFPVPVVDRFVFRVPGLGRLLETIGAIKGSVDECVAHLQQGRILKNGKVSQGDVLLISPGGVREALFSDEFYTVMWENRRGFARISLLSGQPIYPMFTENIRETIRIVQFGKGWWRSLYERTRLPLAIFYGYFPVKLRTYIGDPIYPLPNETSDELANRVRVSIEELIREHQLIPSNLFCAIMQRFPVFDCWLTKHKHSRSSQHQRRT
uniref:Transmembrane protein 68 n=1 Tax=Schistosoma japonicum TaxID=6182 RepID=C1L465_SCHJA|nr:Transmembrane protein 68 [Schistosoma japonicum]